MKAAAPLCVDWKQSFQRSSSDTWEVLQSWMKHSDLNANDANKNFQILKLSESNRADQNYICAN